MSAAQQLAAHSGNGMSKRSVLDYAPAVQPSAASASYKDENTGVGASGSRGANVMNAGVKRRKLENGNPQPGHISSAPILPPTPRPQTLSAAPRMSSGNQVVASKYTIITGAQRAPPRSPKVLSEGRLLDMPSAMEPEMKRVLEQQVLPHVHAAVRPYRDTLTHDERTKIGQTVSFLP